jgi:hypothetical protein
MYYDSLAHGPGMVDHIYNPSYLRGEDRIIVVHGQPGQKLMRPSHKKKKSQVYMCNPSYLGFRGRKIMGQGWLGTSRRSYLKNKLKTGFLK